MIMHIKIMKIKHTLHTTLLQNPIYAREVHTEDGKYDATKV
jgi:hypothetical protein